MPLRRHALLIGCPGHNLPGVSVDIRNYYRFLLSLKGGAWEKAEITTLIDPDRKRLRMEIDSMRMEQHDYTIVAFSGHGWEHKEAGTVLLLRNDEDYLMKDLNTRAQRQLWTLDCCRGVEDSRLLVEDVKYFEKALLESQRRYFREKYEARINQCEKGITILYACSMHESAGENADGGYFTQAMLSPVTWAKANQKIIAVDTMVHLSKDFIDENFEDAAQNPTCNKERRFHYYPWVLLN